MPEKLFVLIPVLNEAGNIARLMYSLKTLSAELNNRFDVRVYLVDDGSKDNTSALAYQAADEAGIRLEVLRHEINQGPGKAFGTGFSHLSPLLETNDLVLTMEGDNTSELELAKPMLTRLNEGFEAIFASPHMYGGQILNTPTYRVFLSSVVNLILKELLGISGILTVTSFFRLYRATALKRLQAVYGPEIIQRHGFECMIEMTMKMINLQMSISEVPMVLNGKARVGKSRMNIMHTVRGYLSLWSLKGKWQVLARESKEKYE